MTDRYDALTAREGRDGKSFFTKLGVAFPNKDGKGWTVLLDAMPAPVEGQFKIMLREPLPKQDSRGGGGAPRQQAPAFETDYDSDVPFLSANPALEYRVR